MSLSLDEDVNAKDIYRLALDGHLTLSVDLINKAYARAGKIISEGEVQFRGIDRRLIGEQVDKKLLNAVIPDAMEVDDGRFIKFEDEIKSIDGVWDLMMIGSEVMQVENLFQSLTGGPVISLTNLFGAFLQKDSVVCEIHERFQNSGSESKAENFSSRNFFHPSELPENSVLVVRQSALSGFLCEFEGSTEKPLKSKERNSLLIMIAALCKEAEIDYEQRGISSAIQHLTEKIGAPLSDDTIRKVVKQLHGALDTRSK